MKRIARRFLPLLMVAGASCSGGASGGGAASAAPVPAAATSVRDGVYTAAQAELGAAEYSTACSSCHAADLRGNSNAPSLVGAGFTFLWEGKSLDELFTTIRTLMPTNAPGSLEVSSYLEILAYILEANGFPEGDVQLSADPEVLGRIMISGA
jgi:quinoprotein glucose dehydrogenase